MSEKNITDSPQSRPVVACSDWLGGIWQRLFGIPIWTEDHDGEVRKSRLWITREGVYLIEKICGKIKANADGTVPRGYVSKWWLR